MRIRERLSMKIKLRPDKDVRVEKIKIGRVPTLVLRPVNHPSIPVSVLWIHGGGYITGMKEMVHMSRAVNLVKKYGVTVYSPGYRLAWIKPYPAAVDDCYQVDELNTSLENCAGTTDEMAELRYGTVSRLPSPRW